MTTGPVPTSTQWRGTIQRRTSGRTCRPCTGAGEPPASPLSMDASMQWEGMTQVSYLSWCMCIHLLALCAKHTRYVERWECSNGVVQE